MLVIISLQTFHANSVSITFLLCVRKIEIDLMCMPILLWIGEVVGWLDDDDLCYNNLRKFLSQECKNNSLSN